MAVTNVNAILTKFLPISAFRVCYFYLLYKTKKSGRVVMPRPAKI